MGNDNLVQIMQIEYTAHSKDITIGNELILSGEILNERIELKEPVSEIPRDFVYKFFAKYFLGKFIEIGQDKERIPDIKEGFFEYMQAEGLPLKEVAKQTINRMVIIITRKIRSAPKKKKT